VKIVAIVQARMGSTRLPGKVLLDLGGETVLARVITRLRRAELVEEVVVATTTSQADEAILEECKRIGVSSFRGSEDDVLDRYYQAATAFGAGAVVRITSDCPLIEPELVDKTIKAFVNRHGDYASNVFPRTYPRGLDTEVFTMPALQRAWKEATQPYQREHVTPYLYEHPEWFRLITVSGTQDYSHYRWTLDTAEDLSLLREIYSRCDNRDDFHWRKVLSLMEQEPDLAAINGSVKQKALREA
jgi:spore coat polysaccharide biosynthesis protein SpsF